MGFIDFLRSFFETKTTNVIGYGTISHLEIRKLIPGVNIVDSIYKLIKKEQIQSFLNTDSVSNLKANGETFDCDDFAIVLLGRLRENFPGFAIGYAHNDLHAFNIFIDDKKKVWIIEPQTDKIFTSTSDRYKLKVVLI